MRVATATTRLTLCDRAYDCDFLVANTPNPLCQTIATWRSATDVGGPSILASSRATVSSLKRDDAAAVATATARTRLRLRLASHVLVVRPGVVRTPPPPNMLYFFMPTIRLTRNEIVRAPGSEPVTLETLVAESENYSNMPFLR